MRNLRNIKVFSKPSRKIIEQPKRSIEKNAESICEQLKFDHENWDEVKKLWRETVKYRQKTIEDLPMSEVLIKWPTYRFAYGYTLVSISFKTLISFHFTN